MEQSGNPSGSADSYVGSLIRLTSKFEVRYEGVLHKLNTQDCTIELQNVRSYGTEGRRKDGAQIPPLDMEFEYILFRGSDIKDLQVISCSPVHSNQHILDDPAIIQSQYACGPSASSSSSPIGGGALTELNSNEEPSASSTLFNPSTLPSHQYGTHLESWGSLANQNVHGASLVMPIYGKGYYGPSSSLPHSQQQTVPFQPPSTMPVALTPQNQLQYHDVLAPRSTSLVNLTGHVSLAPPPIDPTANSFPSIFFSSHTPIQVSASFPSDLSSSLSSRASLPSNLTSVTAGLLTVSSLPLSNQDSNAIRASFSGEPESSPVSGLSIQSLPYSASLIVSSTLGTLLTAPPTLLTPEQLTKPGPLEPYSTQLYPEHKNMEALGPTSSKLLPSASSPPPQGSLLRLPLSSQQSQHSVTELTEEFDFMGMNEKFNKDDDYRKAPKFDAKPVYVKDEFFDTLSCNSLTRESCSERAKFSERMKFDTQTFGDFEQRPHLSHDSRGFEHHGNYRGSSNRGRGYNFGGRGRRGHMPI